MRLKSNRFTRLLRSQKDPYHKLLSDPNMLSNLLGPDNNIYLEQTLTDKTWPFGVKFLFFGPEASTLYWFQQERHFSSPPKVVGTLLRSTIMLTEKCIFGMYVSFFPGFPFLLGKNKPPKTKQ